MMLDFLIRFFVALAAINALSLCAPIGARLAIGFELDEMRRREMTAVAVLLTLGASIMVCALPGYLLPGLPAAGAALLHLSVQLRFCLHMARPGLGALRRLAAPLRPLIIAQWIYGLGCALLCRYYAADALWGYLIGLAALHFARLGYSESESARAVRCTWLSASATALGLLAACAHPIAPGALGFVISMPVIACAECFLLMGEWRRIWQLAPAVLMALTPLLMVPFGAISACALWIAYAALMRDQLYVALLPLRAVLIRRKARRK